MGSSRDGVQSLIEHKKVCEASKSKSDALLKAFESRLYDAQQRVQKTGLTENTVDWRQESTKLRRRRLLLKKPYSIVSI